MAASPLPTSGTREFIEYVARMLVRSDDDIHLTESVEGNVVVYTLKLPSDEVGRVIGREGRIIRSIRSLLRAAAARQGARIVLEVE
ncbi:MAG: KH domain-containing protein [Chloroflexi bacterium]|nr:KH domain-containing protein [Chloroflexota bacterium]